MNPKTVLQLKNELLSKRSNLLNLQTNNNKLEGEQEASKDMVDRSDVEEAWFTRERMSQHWKLELIEIESALHKIEDGSFGICTECEDEIPVKRLRVRPDATLCLNCQETAEREIAHTQRPSARQNSPYGILQ